MNDDCEKFNPDSDILFAKKLLQSIDRKERQTMIVGAQGRADVQERDAPPMPGTATTAHTIRTA